MVLNVKQISRLRRAALSAPLSVIVAVARGVGGRNFWVGLGVAGGVAGAGLVAAFAASIAAAAEGIGQELLNAAILAVAVVMLGCHNVWMSRHGKELAGRVYTVGQAVIGG